MTRFADTVSGKPCDVKPLSTGKTRALLATYDNGIKAVLKLARHELKNGRREQRGIPVAEHPYHEVAYYHLAQLFHYDDLVPETVLAKVHGQECSAQHFVPALHLSELDDRLKEPAKKDPEKWRGYLADTCGLVPRSFWRRLLVLDVVAGVRDRHANNIGLQMRLIGDKPVYRIVAWDNAASFGDAFEKYHNVFHKVLFRHHFNILPVWEDIERVFAAPQKFRDVLLPFLSERAVDQAYRRLQFMHEFSYRLPWRIMSQGHDGANEFPAYRSYFKPDAKDTDLPELAVRMSA